MRVVYHTDLLNSNGVGACLSINEFLRVQGELEKNGMHGAVVVEPLDSRHHV